MITVFYKALDRPVDIFGLRGRWIIIALVFIGVGAVFGIIVGTVTSSLVGVFCFIIVGGVSFLICSTRQKKVSHRQVMKGFSAKNFPDSVSRTETLCCILRNDLKKMDMCRLPKPEPKDIEKGELL